MKKKSAKKKCPDCNSGTSYIDKSKPTNHSYRIDHMNAHLCERCNGTGFLPSSKKSRKPAAKNNHPYHLKTELDKTHFETIHIDNGGIHLSVVDRGADDDGICFNLVTEYQGYPGITASIRLDQYAEEFFNKLEKLIKEARRDFKGINWKERCE